MTQYFCIKSIFCIIKIVLYLLRFVFTCVMHDCRKLKKIEIWSWIVATNHFHKLECFCEPFTKITIKRGLFITQVKQILYTHSPFVFKLHFFLQWNIVVEQSPWGQRGGGGYSTKVYMGRPCPKVQTLYPFNFCKFALFLE